MASSSQSKALSATLLSLALTMSFFLSECHAKSSIHHVLRRFGNVVVSPPHKHKPPFKPGPWKEAHATFYEGGAGTYGGACGYADVVKLGYGENTAALSSVLFNNGQKCGSCYEIKCFNSTQWCKPGEQSLIVTATDHCPADNNGGWCDPPREHFDLTKSGFLQIAEYKAGIVPIRYRQVPCQKQGGIRFEITGNPYFNLVSITNVGGSGDVMSVEVKGDDELRWSPLTRNWGQKWQSNSKLIGEGLTFRVRTSDGKTTTAWNVVPKNWQFGQSFVSQKNFRGMPLDTNNGPNP
ncbi:Expansin [Corchorus olitorius]|uniref:Expansin n=1 Tax=Corchorus olitorius TaxID=93759 RepID=A0A1R3HU14_9ROSI|nr:Expansin [Corchorus olitorius]